MNSVSSVHERAALERYLEGLETADREDEPILENSAVASALRSNILSPFSSKPFSAIHDSCCADCKELAAR